uniref:Uncharacterized protein n=1 Tax=Anguilla anguilla TaxID=7936 RepID=A0A0E9TDK4_ANGAN
MGLFELTEKESILLLETETRSHATLPLQDDKECY